MELTLTDEKENHSILTSKLHAWKELLNRGGKSDALLMREREKENEADT